MKLNWNLVTRFMRPHAQLRAKLRTKAVKLAAHLRHFPSDAVHLQVQLAKEPRRDWFTASLNLRLPSGLLHADKSGPDPVVALDQATRAMLREIETVKSALRREGQRRRQARRERALEAFAA
jgi:ribosome-associated translation inhibitor RaiA